MPARVMSTLVLLVLVLWLFGNRQSIVHHGLLDDDLLADTITKAWKVDLS